MKSARIITAIFGLVCLSSPVLAQQSGQLNLANEPLRPLPQKMSLNADKIALGQDLFNDKSLSKDLTVSCASCHDLAKGGADGRSTAQGVGGAKGDINTPTVFNAGFNFVQFWDGRAESLDAQVAGPINNKVEMGASWGTIFKRLNAVPDYVNRFKAIYGGRIDKTSIQDAIATFERSLITPNSRFDRYLNGDPKAINGEEKAGYGLFKSLGCSACHQGRNIGGNMYQKLGVLRDYFAERGDITKADNGRFNVTKREEDRHVFKVPSLRNVALTAPYFHDASVDNLDAAVEVMGFYQLGRVITDRDRARLVAFLKTLTGEYQGKPLWRR